MCHCTLTSSTLYKGLIYILLFLTGSGFPLRSCITYFCVAMTTIPESSTLKEEGFILVHGARHFSLLQEPRHGSRLVSKWPFMLWWTKNQRMTRTQGCLLPSTFSSYSETCATHSLIPVSQLYPSSGLCSLCGL